MPQIIEAQQALQALDAASVFLAPDLFFPWQASAQSCQTITVNDAIVYQELSPLIDQLWTNQRQNVLIPNSLVQIFNTGHRSAVIRVGFELTPNQDPATCSVKHQLDRLTLKDELLIWNSDLILNSQYMLQLGLCLTDTRITFSRSNFYSRNTMPLQAAERSYEFTNSGRLLRTKLPESQTSPHITKLAPSYLVV